MKNTVFATVFAAVAGFSLAANAGPTAEEQTSPMQVQACERLTAQCKGGDFDSCVDALKSCTQPERKQIMDILANS